MIHRKNPWDLILFAALPFVCLEYYVELKWEIARDTEALCTITATLYGCSYLFGIQSSLLTQNLLIHLIMKQGLKNVLKNTLLIRKTLLWFCPTMKQKENKKNESMKKKDIILRIQLF